MRRATLLLAGIVALAACNRGAEDRRLEAARADARSALVDARCDHDATIVNRPEVQAACNDVRYACSDGPLPELRATAEGCETAVEGLVAASTSP